MSLITTRVIQARRTRRASLPDWNLRRHSSATVSLTLPRNRIDRSTEVALKYFIFTRFPRSYLDFLSVSFSPFLLAYSLPFVTFCHKFCHFFRHVCIYTRVCSLSDKNFFQCTDLLLKKKKIGKIDSKLNFVWENGFHVQVKNRICRVNMAYSLAQETEYTDVIILSPCRRDGKRNLMACGGITWRVIDRQWARSIARRVFVSYSFLPVSRSLFLFFFYFHQPSLPFSLQVNSFLRWNQEQRHPFISTNIYAAVLQPRFFFFNLLLRWHFAQ